MVNGMARIMSTGIFSNTLITQMMDEKNLTVIPGATHLFPEAGALDKVAYYAAEWFTKHLGREA